MLVTASMYSMRDVDVAWLAGLYEGEGWLDIRRPTGERSRLQVRSVRMAIGSTDRDIVDRLAVLVPGSTVTTRGSAQCGKTCTHTHKVMHTWRLSQRDAVADLLGLLLPWLGLRRRQCAEDVLALIAARPETGTPTKTHCTQGHALTPDNLKRRVEKGREYQRCRTCARTAWTAQNRKRALTGQVVSA